MPKPILDEHHISKKLPYFDLKKKKVAKAVLMSAILWNILWFVFRVFFLGESYDFWFFTIGDVSAVPNNYFFSGILLSAVYQSISTIALLFLLKDLRPGFEVFLDSESNSVIGKIFYLTFGVSLILSSVYGFSALLYVCLPTGGWGDITLVGSDLHSFFACSLGFLLQYKILIYWLPKKEVPKDEN